MTEFPTAAPSPAASDSPSGSASPHGQDRSARLPVPLTPDESAASARKWGWWYYAEHFLLQMRRYGSVIVVSAIGEPLIYLLAMGLGLAAVIDGGQSTVDGVSYIVFLAPALLASSALMTAATEFTYPVMGGFKWQRVYFGPQAGPMQPWQIAAGQVTAVALRFLAQSVLFYVVMLLFGVAPSPWAWLQIISAVLGGLAVGLPLMAYASSITQDKGQFALVQRFIIMPLFLFSGTFYPLTNLPVTLQWIGWISPQWHAAQLGRIASYGLQEPWTLTVLRVLYLLALAALGWWLVWRQFTLRLGWIQGTPDRDARVVTPRAGKRRTRGAGRRREGAETDPPGRVETAARTAEPLPPMPEITVRTGPFAGMYAGNIRAVLERGFLALKTNNWAVFASGFVEPVLYLLSMGIGLGALIGAVEGPAGPMSYPAFIAPALLAVSAMNGAIYDSTWNVFFKMRHSKIYRIMLNTSMGPMDVALGEIGMALFRGAVYSTGFLAIMALMGHLTSPWALLMLPAAVLIAFAFAAVGMAITSYMTKFQQMDWIMVVLMPMFLFSATFFPLSVYPEQIQWVIQALPLWHGVELLRQLSVGVFTAGTLVHVLYFVVMVIGGMVFASIRLKALFLR